MSCFKRSVPVALCLALWTGPCFAQDIRSVLLIASKQEEGGRPPATPWQGVAAKAPRSGRYFLPTGFTFPVRLENAIYSYNVETPAMVVVDRNIEFLGKVIIPKGTRLLGTVGVLKSHDRVLINFHTMVFPEGEEIKLTAIALSVDGTAGLKGKVETHKDSAVANTVLRSLVVGTQAAIDIAVANPVTGQVTQGVSQEAVRELELERQQVTTSISVDTETGLRVYLSHRTEY